MAKTIVTKHAKKRIRERVGGTKKAAGKIADHAFERGYHHAHTKGALYLWIKQRLSKSENVTQARIYCGKIYLFTNDNVLVTVYPLPAEFANRLPQYIRKERTDKTKEEPMNIKTISKAQESFVREFENAQSARPGEIWSCRMSNGDDRYCIILSTFEKFASVLMLTDRLGAWDNDRVVEVLGRTKLYADAGMLSYLFYDKLDHFIKTLPEEGEEGVLTFGMLRASVRRALGLEDIFEWEKTQGANGPVPVPVVDETELVAKLKADADEMQKRLIRVQAESDVFRRLYEELLAKNLEGAKDAS